MIGAGSEIFFRNISNVGLIGIFFYHFQFLWIFMDSIRDDD